MLLSSGPIYQRTLDLNRKQQSYANPTEFIYYVCLQDRLAVCLVQLLSKPTDILNPSPNDSPEALSPTAKTLLLMTKNMYISKSVCKS